MTERLVDRLWRDHPDAPGGGSRGPRAKRSLSELVDRAVAMADRSGLEAVTVRALSESLGMSTMSVYTHVETRDDLVVLMADAVHASMPRPSFGRSGWRTRVRRVADANLALLVAHPWLLQVRDPRVALGPGTIAKYDHELHAFEGTGLDDVHRDAALTFLLDFVRSSAAVQLASWGDFAPVWAAAAGRLERYVEDRYPLARRVGRAAGEHMGSPYGAAEAWSFGIERVIAGLADVVGRTPPTGARRGA